MNQEMEYVCAVDNHAMKDRYGRVPGQQCVPVDESVVIEDDIRTR